MKGRTISIIGEISSEGFQVFNDEMRELELSPNKPITIELCSHGGETYPALAFYARITTSPCVVTIKASGQVMSAATIILASGDRRLMHQDCWFMVHDDSQRIRSDNGVMARSEAEHKDLLETHWASILARHTNLIASDWRELSRKTSYLSSEECLKAGVIDEIFR